MTFKNGIVSEVIPRDFELGVLTGTPSQRTVYIEAARAKVQAERERADVAAAAVAAAAREKADAARAKSEADAAEARRIAAADRKRREAEPLVRVTNSQALAIMRDAAKFADNHDDSFRTAFLSAAQKLAPEFTGMQSVVLSKALTILISGPLGLFLIDASERVRKFEPLTPPPAWRPEVDIIIGPDQIDAPDIEKVIVQRNGVIVPPLRSALIAREMVTRMGAKSVIHSGSVAYPLSTFEPGAGVTVTVIAIPASGSNITRTFDSLELRAIQ